MEEKMKDGRTIKYQTFNELNGKKRKEIDFFLLFSTKQLLLWQLFFRFAIIIIKYSLDSTFFFVFICDV